MILSSKNLVTGSELQSGANPCHSIFVYLVLSKGLGIVYFIIPEQNGVNLLRVSRSGRQVRFLETSFSYRAQQKRVFKPSLQREVLLPTQ